MMTLANERQYGTTTPYHCRVSTFLCLLKKCAQKQVAEDKKIDPKRGRTSKLLRN